MRREMIVPAALAALSLAGAAEAQVTNTTPGVTNPNTGFNQGTFNNGFNNGFNNNGFNNNGFNNGFNNNGFNNGFNGGGFNNGFGVNGFPQGSFGNGFGANGFNPGTFNNGLVDPRLVDPRQSFFDPRLNVNGSSLGFTPGVTPGNQFIPGNGGGYWNGWGPYGGGGMVIDPTTAWNQGWGGGGGNMRGGLRILGVNSPPLRPGNVRRARVRNSGSGSGFDAQAQARADAIAAAGGNPAVAEPAEPLEVRRGATDPEQNRLASRMENVMQDRPLVGGMVMRRDATGVMVRFEQDGELRMERFTPGQVFFFQDGRLATGSTNMRGLQPGDEVMVPMPAAMVRQSVAGSRQEIGSTVGSAARSTAKKTTVKKTAKKAKKATRKR